MRLEPKPSPPDLPKASRWNLVFMKRTNRVAMGVFLLGIVYYIITRLVLKQYQ